MRVALLWRGVGLGGICAWFFRGGIEEEVGIFSCFDGMNLDLFDDGGLGGFAQLFVGYRSRGDFVEGFQAFGAYYFAENGVHAVELGGVFVVQGDEKLRAGGISIFGARGVVGGFVGVDVARHGEDAALVFAVGEFGVDVVAGAAGAVAARVAALDEEIGFDAVEGETFVETIARERKKVADVVGGGVVVEGNGHVADVGGDDAVNERLDADDHGAHGRAAATVFPDVDDERRADEIEEALILFWNGVEEVRAGGGEGGEEGFEFDGAFLVEFTLHVRGGI